MRVVERMSRRRFNRNAAATTRPSALRERDIEYSWNPEVPHVDWSLHCMTLSSLLNNDLPFPVETVTVPVIDLSRSDVTDDHRMEGIVNGGNDDDAPHGGPGAAGGASGSGNSDYATPNGGSNGGSNGGGPNGGGSNGGGGNGQHSTRNPGSNNLNKNGKK